ncbi:MAG: glucose-6-phosphate isomerase family protein [Acidobacteriaceae bacterium]|nr:glucose-6-phosphate isomerase family protein [Acidobacteriaceae bacterium]
MSAALSNSPNSTFVDWHSGLISGDGIEESVKTLGQLSGIFHDEAAWRSMNPETETYRVRFWRPVPDGTTGGLFWGCTVLQPGRVGDEYFMTHGHFHSLRDRAEYYATATGKGILLLMDESGKTWDQTMTPGTVHYIPGKIAHRVVNTGDQPLVFLASWPSDAGHDYAEIRTKGFTKRVVQRDGQPCLV